MSGGMLAAGAVIDVIEWWYPVAFWAVVFAAVARAVLPAAGPAWLPLAAGTLSLVPVDGLLLGRWLHGINANFCIPFAAVLLDFVLTPLLRRPLLDARARRTALWFGIVGGLLLYPLALGIGPFDPYVLGWRSPGIAAAAAVLGAALLLWNNAFGFVLLIAGVAWQVGLLESTNAWDYLLDPVYCLLSAANVVAGGLAAGWRRFARRGAAATVATIAMASACPCCRTAAAVEEPPKTADQLDAEWSAAAADLDRRATALGLEPLAKLIREWRLPEEVDRQFVVAIPSRLERPDWIDTPDEQSIWDDFCGARRDNAAGTFALSLAAARAHGGRQKSPADKPPADAAPPPLAQRSCEAVRLLHRVLRDDPEHARAREAGGWVRRQGEWIWPEAARRLEKGENHADAYGWLPKGRLARYEAGERYAGGRWITAEDDAKRPRTLDRAWKHASDHWQIASTAGLEEAAQLAKALEETHVIWRQAFGGFVVEPAELERRLEGRGRVTAREPFAATLLCDRDQYVAELEKLEPTIARTLGLYWTPTHMAWFFAGEGQEPITVRHEGAHQLFAEMRATSPLAGERCGFWAVEAAACYLESLQPAAFGWTLGGLDAGRAPVARERLLDDGFHVPLAELAAKGRRDLQADERLPQIYSELAGLADFFMNGRRARYREAFVEYLVRIYTGTVDADTLSRLCNRGYADLDEEYRRHMAR
jgi:hypothetical protein